MKEKLVASQNRNTDQTERASRTRFYASLYLFVVGFYLLTASGRIGLSDSVAMFNVAQSVLDKRSISSEPCEFDVNAPDAGASIGCIPGSGGRHFAGYGLVPSLLGVPAILFARSVSKIVHVDPLVASKAAVSLLTVLVAPLVCLALASWMLNLGYSRRTATIGACIFGLASPFWHSSVVGFLSEPYFTLALLVAASVLSNPRRGLACGMAGLAFGVACGVRLNGVILLPAYILSMALHTRRNKLSRAHFLRDILQFGASFSVCAVLIAMANYVRFGSPFKTGYHLAFPSAATLLSTPLFHGLREVLFNGEVGLLVFAPWIVIALISFPQFIRMHPPEAVLCGTGALIYVLFFAKYSDWHGGWVAGPRLLIPVLPFLVLAMASAIQQRRTAVYTLMLTLVGIGFLIQAVGAPLPVERYYALVEFYKHRPSKPWWSGSIPLASVDFLSKMKVTGIRVPRAVELDPLIARHQGEAVFASADSAGTEDQFLDRFPNSVNMTSPNLLLFKLGLMGLRVSVGISYLLVVVVVCFSGALGLNDVRCVCR